MIAGTVPSRLVLAVVASVDVISITLKVDMGSQ
jgi:hypothetical protein